MNLGKVNQENRIWFDKMKETIENNNKQAKQAIQSYIGTSEKNGFFIKDMVEVSDEAKTRAKETRNETENMAERYEELKRLLDDARKIGEAMAEEAKVRLKCLMIAMRIMAGDTVPREDYRYLAKNDLELYSKAVSMRIEQENPKKHKKISESDNKEARDNTEGAESVKSDSGEIQTETSGDSENRE